MLDMHLVLGNDVILLDVGTVPNHRHRTLSLDCPLTRCNEYTDPDTSRTLWYLAEHRTNMTPTMSLAFDDEQRGSGQIILLLEDRERSLVWHPIHHIHHTITDECTTFRLQWGESATKRGHRRRRSSRTRTRRVESELSAPRSSPTQNRTSSSSTSW